MNNYNQISVLLADDEQSIREGLNNSIAWEELNTIVVDVVSDGKQALASLLELQPDICIIDICMPGLTGLEVIKMCKQKGLETQFLILSGYSDFSYAQEAIQYGAKGYLLKPINLEKLMSELYNLCSNIIEKKSLNINMDHLRKTSKLHVLNQLIRGEMLSSKLGTLPLQNFKISNSPSRVIICSFKQEEESPHFEEDIISILENSHFPVTCEVWSPQANQVILLFNDATKDLELSHQIAKHCMRKLTPYAPNLIGIGIGDLVLSLDQTAYSYNRALLTLSYQMYNEVPTIHDPSNICNTAPAISPSNIDYSNLTAAILSVDYDKMNHYCDSFFYSLFYIPQPPPTFVKGMCIYLVVNVLKDLNAKVQHDFAFPLVSYEELNQLVTFVELKNWILSFFHDCCKIAASITTTPHGNAMDNVIEKAKQYIHTNIQNNIKTKDIALYVNLSDSYCSAYFKQKTGISLRDYILNSKIDYAKSRILENNITVSEIAYELGYTDYRSFSRAFKNLTGISPSEYAQQNTPST